MKETQEKITVRLLTRYEWPPVDREPIVHMAAGQKFEAYKIQTRDGRTHPGYRGWSIPDVTHRFLRDDSGYTEQDVVEVRRQG